MPLIRHFSLLQLLQRFRLEYHHEPLDLRQKLLTVPDQPVKIKFVDRGWLYPVSLLFVLVVSDGSFLTFFNSRTYTQSYPHRGTRRGGWWNPLPPWVFYTLQYLASISKRVCLQWKAFHLLYKMRYVLWVVALLGVCDVTKHGRHLGSFKNYNSGKKREN